MWLQIEGEKAELGERRREAEVERASAREETGRLQQELQDLTADRRALEISYSLLQETNQRLEAELALLQRENNQILERHAQVRLRPPLGPPSLPHYRLLLLPPTPSLLLLPPPST